MKALIRHITKLLETAYPADEAESLAWWVAEETTGLSRTQLILAEDLPLTSAQQQVIERLLRFEPIQYIFGHTLWNGLDLKLSPATLIPRPETAELVVRLNDQIVNDQIVNAFDFGTGSGCIAIALKKAHPSWNVIGIDISPEAIEIARENAARNGVDVTFLQADLFSDEIEEIINSQISNLKSQMSNLKSQISNVKSQISNLTYIISNPPYICEREKISMRPNVLRYEPGTALFVPDDDPLLFYRRIASLFVGRKPPLFLFFEINEAYGQPLAQLLLKLGYTDIQITKDSYGKDRIIQGRLA